MKKILIRTLLVNLTLMTLTPAGAFAQPTGQASDQQIYAAQDQNPLTQPETGDKKVKYHAAVAVNANTDVGAGIEGRFAIRNMVDHERSIWNVDGSLGVAGNSGIGSFNVEHVARKINSKGETVTGGSDYLHFKLTPQSMQYGVLFNGLVKVESAAKDSQVTVRGRPLQLLIDRNTGAAGYNPSIVLELKHQLGDAMAVSASFEAGLLAGMANGDDRASNVGYEMSANGGMDIYIPIAGTGESKFAIRPEATIDTFQYNTRNSNSGIERNNAVTAVRPGFVFSGAF